jgi:hypothetical protein
MSHNIHRFVPGLNESKIASRMNVLTLLQGMALRMCPKNKLFRGYIDLEIQL